MCNAGTAQRSAYEDWGYRKPVTVINSLSTLTDYDFLIEIDTASLLSGGKMQADRDDLPVADSDGSTQLITGSRSLQHCQYPGAEDRGWRQAHDPLSSTLFLDILVFRAHQTLQQPILLAYAIGIAVINMAMAKTGLDEFFMKKVLTECRYQHQLALNSTKEYGFLRFLVIRGRIDHIY